MTDVSSSIQLLRSKLEITTVDVYFIFTTILTVRYFYFKELKS